MGSQEGALGFAASASGFKGLHRANGDTHLGIPYGLHSFCSTVHHMLAQPRKASKPVFKGLNNTCSNTPKQTIGHCGTIQF